MQPNLVPETTVRSPGVHRCHPSLLPISSLATADTLPEVTVWWLGQAGFAIRHPHGTLLIDPYLSDSLATKYADAVFPHERLHAPPIAAADLRGVDLVLHSHAHTDHLDPWTVGSLIGPNDPHFVVPRARRDVALERNVPAERLSSVTAADQICIEGIHITVVPAAHEEVTVDSAGDHVFLGYVVDIAGIRIYHSGDCVPFDGQAELLSELQIDLAFLPVNGRDAHRLSNGVPGNFTVEEAVQLCHAANIPELVCHHVGLFEFNTVAPDQLTARLTHIAHGLAWTVPAVGAGFLLTKDPS